MKTFSGAARRGKALDRSAALACAGLNLLATPGLGTLMGGRIAAGVAQLAMATVGFGMVMAWMGLKLWSMFGNAEPPRPLWWQVGAPLFFAAWVASAWSSYDMWRKAGPALPPKLNEM